MVSPLPHADVITHLTPNPPPIRPGQVIRFSKSGARVLETELAFYMEGLCERCGQEPLFCDCEIEREWNRRVKRGQGGSATKEVRTVATRKSTQETLLDVIEERDRLREHVAAMVLGWY